MDIAVVGWAAVTVDGGKCARIDLGAWPHSLLTKAAGDSLVGKPVNDESIAAAAALARKCNAVADMRGAEYRTHLVGVLASVVKEAANRASAR
jgi:hypothetical protein